jgi:hypothetical protein
LAQCSELLLLSLEVLLELELVLDDESLVLLLDELLDLELST